MFCARLIVYVMFFTLLFGCAASTQNQADKAQKADVHFKLGLSHLQSNNPTLALKELLIAVDNGPENSAIHAAIAQAYQLKRAYLQAEQHYLKAITLSDNNPDYQNNLASLYLDLEKWDKAIEYFDKAAGNLLFTSPHIALSGKGYAHLKKQDYQAALQQFKEVITIAPRYPQAYYLQSEAYLGMGMREQALFSLERAIDVAPGFGQVLYQLGIMYLQDQRIDDARNSFQRAVELGPTSDWGLKSSEMLRSIKKTGSE